MSPLLALLALWPFHGHPLVTDDRGVAKHWRYDLVRDRFGGGESCRLSRGEVEVYGGFVYFKLGKPIDTADALYKIDDRPAKRWRLLAPSLVAAGLKVQDDSVANPSGGRVILPLADVIDAREVEIRPAGQQNPRRFPIYALSIAVERAAQHGCEVERPSGAGPDARR